MKHLLISILVSLGLVLTAHSQSVREVRIKTESGSKIWIDGVFRGIADERGLFVAKPVHKGSRRVRVRADGFAEANRVLRPRQRSLTVSLKPTRSQAVLLFQEAERLLSEDKETAIEKYKESLRLNRRNPDVWVALARAQSEVGDHDDAFDSIRSARRYRPGFAEASAVEGRVFRSIGDLDKAVESFERAIREGRGFQPEAHTGLALIAKEDAEDAAARADFEEERLYYLEAAKSFEKAIDQLSATEPVVYLFLGDIYEKMKEKKKAIAVYRRFLRDMPDHEEATAVESFIVQFQKEMGADNRKLITDK